jgi:integrase
VRYVTARHTGVYKLSQELLGHATILITLDTYFHIVPRMGYYTATMEDALSEYPKEQKPQ